MPEEPSSQQRLDAFMARLAQHSEQERVAHRDFREQAHRGRTFRLESHGRFMILAAGIAGVVIPLLAREQTLANPNFLMWASVMFVTAIAVGAIGQFVDGRLHKRLGRTFSAYSAADLKRNLAAEMAAAGGEAAVRTHAPKLARDTAGVEAAAELFEAAQSLHSRVGTGVDVVFYGMFILGLVLLVLGVLLPQVQGGA